MKTVLEINLQSLEYNFNKIKSLVKPATKTMAVVKANGYGSDIIAVAKKLDELGVDYFSVAYANEGVKLRNAGVKTPILVLYHKLDHLMKLLVLSWSLVFILFIF